MSSTVQGGESWQDIEYDVSQFGVQEDEMNCIVNLMKELWTGDYFSVKSIFRTIFLKSSYELADDAFFAHTGNHIAQRKRR